MDFGYRYYLETNALYHISKYDKKQVGESFTSALALYELIAGMDAATYQRRKGILHLTQNSGITIDWRLPEEILFESYSAGEEFKFVDTRTDKLETIFNQALAIDSFEEFRATANDIFEYFSSLDKRWGSSFIQATVAGNGVLKETFIHNPDETIVFNGKTYPVNTPEQMKLFLTEQPAVNRAITVNAFVQMFMASPAIQSAGFTEEEVHDSYNGWTDHFMDAFSVNSMSRMLGGQAPAKNDFVDLLHLLYLRNFKDCKIVSDDKIFAVCEHLRVKISDLLNQPQ
jgi:hypothetical protein